MIAADDSWFVRFPDGRVIRAANATVVRQYIQQRHIVPGCMMRRSGEDEWRPLERIREFVDALPASPARRHTDGEDQPLDLAPRGTGSGVAARLDRQRLRTAGILPILQEALAALDTSLTPRKLVASAILTALLGTILVTALALASLPTVAAQVWPVAAAVSVLVTLAAVGLLARLTYVELQRMRPAHWKDGTAGLLSLTCRLTLANAVAAVVLVGVPTGLLALSNWLLSVTASPWHVAGTALAHASAVLALVVTVGFVPLAVATLLMAPILVFEECSVFAAVRMWVGLVRRNLSRVILNEVVLVAIAGLLAAPFLLAVLTAGLVHVDDRLALTLGSARTVLTFLASAPAVSFVVVANVFLFVNLRYQTTYRRSRIR
jgi:hypothetical protein